MKDCRRKTSSENLKFLKLNWNLFVKRIVTGDMRRGSTPWRPWD